MSFLNLLTNDFLDHSKASEDFFYFYTFDFYTCKNYTFKSVAVSAHAHSSTKFLQEFFYIMHCFILYFEHTVQCTKLIECIFLHIIFYDEETLKVH